MKLLNVHDRIRLMHINDRIEEYRNLISIRSRTRTLDELVRWFKYVFVESPHDYTDAEIRAALMRFYEKDEEKN